MDEAGSKSSSLRKHASFVLAGGRDCFHCVAYKAPCASCAITDTKSPCLMLVLCEIVHVPREPLGR